jgi:hypothetical protein
MFLNKPSIFFYYEEAKKKIQEEVAAQPDSYLLTVIIEDYVLYLFEKYSLPEIIFDNTHERTIEKIRKTAVYEDFGRLIPMESLLVRIMLPVNNNDKISEVLGLKPNVVSLNSPKMIYEKSFIITEAAADESAIGKAISDITQEVDRRNTDIRKSNEELKRKIREIISLRRTKIVDEDTILENITKKVSVSIKQKTESSNILPSSLKVKQKIQPIMPPKTTSQVEFCLKSNEFNAIIELIDNCCKMFERTPATFSKMEEEELRDVMLSSLNGVFEGDAVGEAFSKFGKTDIYLKVNKGHVFIAECKYWKGPITLEGSIAQILNYLTWRHSYGVVIMFSRNKGFSDVIESLFGTIPKVASYVKGLEKLEDTHYKALHHLPDDDRKLVELHYLIYNLYAEKVTIK